MATNKYFQSGITNAVNSEQLLIEDLIVESMQIYGHDIYYLPRTSVKHDFVFGEDILSQFTAAYPIEMYLANVSGWGGDREVFSKFGIEVRDKATFIVSKRRWEESIAQIAQQLPNRPAEGDLLYFSKTNATFEIKFVDHLDPFFQLGKFYVYTLQCEMYQYSAELINTGIPEIDADFPSLSADMFERAILEPDGDHILMAGGTDVINTEGFKTTEVSPLSNTEHFEEEGVGLIVPTVTNPFGTIG